MDFKRIHQDIQFHFWPKFLKKGGPAFFLFFLGITGEIIAEDTSELDLALKKWNAVDQEIRQKQSLSSPKKEFNQDAKAQTSPPSPLFAPQESVAITAPVPVPKTRHNAFSEEKILQIRKSLAAGKRQGKQPLKKSSSPNTQEKNEFNQEALAPSAPFFSTKEAVAIPVVREGNLGRPIPPPLQKSALPKLNKPNAATKIAVHNPALPPAPQKLDTVAPQPTEPAPLNFLKKAPVSGGIIIPTNSPLLGLRSLNVGTQPTKKDPASKKSPPQAPNFSLVAQPAPVQALKQQQKDFSQKFIPVPVKETKKEETLEPKKVDAPPQESAQKSEEKMPKVLEIKMETPPQAVPPKSEEKAPSEAEAPSEKDTANKAETLPKEEFSPLLLQEKPQTEDKVTETDLHVDKETYAAIPIAVITTTEEPKVKFSGDLCTFISTAMQEDTSAGSKGEPHISFGWANLALEVAGAFKGDFHYKAAMNLRVVPGDISADEAYVEVSGRYGTFQMGNLKGVEATFINDATSLLGGTSGVDGSIFDLFTPAAGSPHTHHLAGYTKKATKISAYTPRFAGFRVGVSFCPNPHHVGWDTPSGKSYADVNTNDDSVFHNADMEKRMNVAVGINFQQEVQDLIFDASLVAVREKTTMTKELKKASESESGDASVSYTLTTPIALKKDTSYQASGSITYKKFQIAAGFINNGEINLPKDLDDAEKLTRYGLHLGNSGKAWNIGGKYTLGCIDLAIAQHKTSRRVTNYSYASGTFRTFTVDCQLFNGVQAFVEVTHVNTQTDKSVAGLYKKPEKNKGTAIFVGSKVSF
ncbi:hypothetical protein AGMMS49949_00380 [Alphaproteobacteria bacterium]|nr:hypothetical protein AGMMS49949_00380 [Alphaproteobacteria bacterium]GHS95842.1 hypothetical protein AGMMS50296_1140 [Alphaproteobacteria bacterium]